MRLKVDRHEPVPLFLKFLKCILIDYKEAIDVYQPGKVISNVAPVKCVQ